MALINLLPDDYVQQRCRHRANLTCIVLFAIIMITVVAAKVVTNQNARYTVRIREQLNRDYDNAAALIGEVLQLQIRKNELIKKARISTDLMDRLPKSYVLAVIDKALPEGVSLTDLTLNTKVIIRGTQTKFDKAKQKQAAVEESFIEIDLTGLAEDHRQVGKLIYNLGQASITKSVDLVVSREKIIDGVSVREFELKIALKENPELPKRESLAKRSVNEKRGITRSSSAESQTAVGEQTEKNRSAMLNGQDSGTIGQRHPGSTGEGRS